MTPLLASIVFNAFCHMVFSGMRLAVALDAIHLGASAAAVGAISALFGLLPAMGSIAMGRFIDRNGSRLLLKVCPALLAGAPLMLAGLWNEWTDPDTGEITPSYTMFTINCNAHPVLRKMHRPVCGPDGVPLPEDQQDKRAVVPLEPDEWRTWLQGSPADAAALIDLPADGLYAHGSAEPEKGVPLL